MKPVLVIAYLFPPLGGGGVQRTLAFVEHLPALGWRPIVIAASADAPYWAFDRSLLDRVPAEAVVHRVAEGPLGFGARALRRMLPKDAARWLDAAVLLPDRQITWLPGATVRAIAAARETGAQAIYSTGSPWTDHLVGALVKAATGLPWIADFRDPWTQNQTFAPATPLHARALVQLEGMVHAKADRVVANTALNLKRLHAAFPVTRGKALHIPNGWSEADFQGLPAAPATGRCTIGYAGSFYPGYGPDRLFALLARVLEADPKLRSQVRLQLAGQTNQTEAIRNHHLTDVVTELGYLPQHESLIALAESHATLLVLPPSDETSGWVPQKLYVYLRLGRPILAVCPNGEAADIIRAAGGGSLVLSPDDPNAAQRLAAWLRERIDAAAPAPFDPAVVARYDRRTLTRTLAHALDGLTGAPAV